MRNLWLTMIHLSRSQDIFNIFKCGNNILNKLDATCERACMATLRDKYYTEFFRTITDCNDRIIAPLYNGNIQNGINKVIAE